MTTASLRLTQWAIVTLITGIVGLVAVTGAFPPVVEGVLSAIVIMIGPGAALRTWVRMPPALSLIVVPTFGIALLLIGATVMVDTRTWDPETSEIFLVAGLVIVGLSRWQRPTGASVPSASRKRRRRPLPRRVVLSLWASRLNVGVLFIAAAVLLFIASVPGLAQAPASPYGLLASGVAGGQLLASALSAVIGFVISVRRGALVAGAAALVVTVLVFRLPTILATTEPLYSWTYKHLGVVDYIVQNGHVASGVDIYSGWPGFFAGVAWFVTVTGVSALSIAHGFIVAVDIVLILGSYAICRAYRLSPSVALVGAFIASIANWVGQDYFSPQAVAYVLAAAVVSLLLRSRRSPGLGWIAVPYFVAIVLAHQLTPYWLIGVTLALGVLGRQRPRYLGVVFGVIAGTYLWFNRDALGDHQLISGLSILSNATTLTPGTGSLAQTLTSLASRAVSAAVLGGAAVAAGYGLIRLRGHRRGRILGAAAIAFTSFALLLGQGYGGEAIFRVYLYAIPGCVLLVAPAVTRLLVPRRIRRVRKIRGSVAVGAGLVFITLASLHASYGAWFVNLVTHDSVTVAQVVDDQAPDNAILLSPLSAGPGRMTARYADLANDDPFFDASLSSWSGWLGRDFRDDQWLPGLTADLESTGRPAYILVNDQMRAYAEYNGLYPQGALENFVQKLSNSRDWKMLVSSSSAQAWVLEPHDG
jgi:hypothetical protein